jgi:hypothetical protein
MISTAFVNIDREESKKIPEECEKVILPDRVTIQRHIQVDGQQGISIVPQLSLHRFGFRPPLVVIFK